MVDIVNVKKLKNKILGVNLKKLMDLIYMLEWEKEGLRNTFRLYTLKFIQQIRS